MNRRFASACSAALTVLAVGATAALAAAAPGVSSGGASAVTPQTATLNGKVNPRGAPTAYYFQFGTTASYGRRTASGDAGAGSSTRAVSAALSGLKPNTTYHFRLVAFNPSGTSRGADRRFKTPQVPTTSSISASPNPVAFPGTVSVAGSLSGPNVANKQVALERRVFPFTGPFEQIGNTVLTTPQGAYSFLVPALVTMELRVVDRSKPSVTSAIVTENVALATTLGVRHARRSRLDVRFFGRVSPARVGNAVLIQRRLRRSWKTLGVALTRRGRPEFSHFSKRLRLGAGGTFRVVVRTSAGDYVDATSRELKIRLPRRPRRR